MQTDAVPIRRSRPRARWVLPWTLIASLPAGCRPAAPSLAEQVTITRDRYGIPHVHGESDAATVFGFAFAQAEDHYRQLEDNFIRALGRLAEVEGEGALEDDRLNRALEIPRLARDEYARLDADMRALVDAFASGVNYFLQRRRDVAPRLLARIEAWYPLAFIRYNYYQNGFAQGAMRQAGLRRAGAGEPIDDGHGSNGWVIAPGRTRAGHALLFINPHLPYFGPGQVYEGHLRSDAGWHFTGYARFGFPLPYVGHNEDLGWVSTDNAADQFDAYLETFDDPADPLAYRHGTGHRRAVEWTDTIRVRRGDSIEARVFRFRKTHHGPVVGEVGGRPVAIALAKLEADGWLREWYRMTRARNLAEFKAAMRPLEMQFGNAMYADREGNLFYLYNGAVPRRDPSFDWGKAVDGSDPRADWQGYHDFEELPQLENPASSWMQNCNGTPFLLTDRGNPDSTRYPRYMVTEPDTYRAMMSRRILAEDRKWTLEDLAVAAFDTRVVAADSALPGWIREARRGPAGAERREALGVLEAWDRRADTASAAMTLLATWVEWLGRDLRPGPALDSALASLGRDFGSWRVPYGEWNRLQRWDPFAGESGSDARPSLAHAGVPSWLGGVFTTIPVPQDGQRRRYAVAGGSYVSAVEFGPTVRALAVHPFGASGDPGSPHYFDQAPLFAAGRFRPAWFTAEEVAANAERTYRPADR
jgi:penicillin amidase